jgi:hypothetical protein
MKKALFSLFAPILCAVSSLICPSGASAQSFSVTFPKTASAQPLDGRLLLMLSTDPSDEPRSQIDDSPRTQMIFGVNVDGWQPGQSQVVDASAWGYPIRSLKDVPPGEYYVQALLNKYETFHRGDGKTVKMHMDQGEGQHWNISPGNLYSTPVKIKIGPGSAAECLFPAALQHAIPAEDSGAHRKDRSERSRPDELEVLASKTACVGFCPVSAK